MLGGRQEVVEALRHQADAIAQKEAVLGNLVRAEARRRVDRWVVQGFSRNTRLPLRPILIVVTVGAVIGATVRSPA